MLLTKKFLSTLGIELEESSYQSLALHFETTLQDRVIDEIVAELTPGQAEQLAHMMMANDEAIHDWLMQNIPDLADIVSDEVDILLGEVAEDGEKITG